MMRWMWNFAVVIVFLAVTVIAVLAVVDNASVVALQFLDWRTPELSIYWWLLAALLLGFALGWLTASMSTVRAKRAARRAERRVRDVAAVQQ